jgi:hypothetical protein
VIQISLGQGVLGKALLSTVAGTGYLALDGIEARMVEKADAIYLQLQVAERQYLQVETYERLQRAEEVRQLRRRYAELDDLSRKLRWIKSKRALSEDQAWTLEEAESDKARIKMQILQLQEASK